MADTIDLEVKLNTKEADDWKVKFQEPIKIDVQLVKQYQDDLNKVDDSSSSAQSFSGYSTQDRDLNREYQRLSIQKYRYEIPLLRSQRGQTITQSSGDGFTKDLQSLMRGLGGQGGVFNPMAMASAFNILGRVGGRRGGVGSGLAVAGGTAIGARIVRNSIISGANAAEAAGTAAMAGGAEAGAAGSTEGMIIGGLASFLKKPSVLSILAGTAATLDYAVASRGAARGRYAAGLGGTVGGISATQLGFERYVDPKNVLDAMAQAKYDITSPAYRAMSILGIKPGGKPEDMAAQSTIAVARQLKSFGKQDEQTMLTMAHATGLGNLGYSDADLIRLYGADPKELAAAAKKAKTDAGSYDLPKDQVKALQDNVQWMKEWATEGETIAEKTAALGTQYVELSSDVIPKVIKKLDDLVSGFDIFSPVLNFANKEAQKFGETLRDWAKKYLPDVIGGAEAAEGGGGGGGGGGGRGAPASIRARTTAKGDIHFPAGGTGGTGKKEPGLYATDIGLVATKSMDPAEAAFLDTLATGETPRGSYSNRSGDPGGLGGRYQFLLSTWNSEAVKAGVNPKDFSPENQDKVAWFYAREVVKQKTGKSLSELLAQGPEGVRKAIAALSPGVWNAITNIDPDKSGHSGAVRLYNRKLEEEKAAKGSGKVSMNDMKTFQGMDNKFAVNINNRAGADYTISSGMLGAGMGNYGNG